MHGMREGDRDRLMTGMGAAAAVVAEEAMVVSGREVSGFENDERVWN